MSYIDKLDDLVLTEIFNKLDVPDLIRLEMVCRTFYKFLRRYAEYKNETKVRKPGTCADLNCFSCMYSYRDYIRIHISTGLFNQPLSYLRPMESRSFFRLLVFKFNAQQNNAYTNLLYKIVYTTYETPELGASDIIRITSGEGFYVNTLSPNAFLMPDVNRIRDLKFQICCHVIRFNRKLFWPLIRSGFGIDFSEMIFTQLSYIVPNFDEMFIETYSKYPDSFQKLPDPSLSKRMWDEFISRIAYNRNHRPVPYIVEQNGRIPKRPRKL